MSFKHKIYDFIYNVKYKAFSLFYRLKKNIKEARQAEKFADSSTTTRSYSPNTQSYKKAQSEQLNLDLQKITKNLAVRAWRLSNNKKYSDFVIKSSQLHSKNCNEIMSFMLDHAYNIASGLEVPFATPKIFFSDTPTNTVGSFQIDERGVASITVSSQFMLNRKALCAILSHELCHYILENAGIREKDHNKNEVLTDICMFVLGYGELFLAGYKSKLAQSGYRAGHKFGYLKDYQYSALKGFIKELHCSIVLPSETDELRSKINQRLFGNKAVYERYMKEYKRKYPELVEKERLKRVLEDLDKR